MQYRKKLLFVEAVQYKGNGNFDNPALPEWIWKAFEDGILFFTNGADPLMMKTVKDDSVVPPDDYIILGNHRRIFHSNPQIFEYEFDPVEGKGETERKGLTAEDFVIDRSKEMVAGERYSFDEVVELLKSFGSDLQKQISELKSELEEVRKKNESLKSQKL